MQTTFAPWRMKFINESINKKMKGCLFCNKPKSKKDKENLLLYRGNSAFVMLNLYPYNTGHLMVAPKKHAKDFDKLTSEEMLELMQLTRDAVKVLRKVYKPKGFNIGVNLGSAAGAGIKGHLHIHIVPRWIGDVNFMPATCDTKVIPEALSVTYNKLKPYFKTISFPKS